MSRIEYSIIKRMIDLTKNHKMLLSYVWLNSLFIDLVTKVISYQYVDIPQTDVDKVTNLQAQNAQMLMALVMGVLM